MEHPQSILKKPQAEVQEGPRRSTRGQTKQVTWADESTLVDIVYIQKISWERVNVAKGVVMNSANCSKFCSKK